MNKEEIKFDHFKDIEELIQHLEMWYAEDDYYAYDRFFNLRDARIMGMFIYELQKENKLLKHRLETANDFIEDRKENMIPEHYDDLKYIINECDLNSSW